ncbi:MAG: hypothetical protein K9G02_01170 [Microbacteriaceae bacterium]|nr:hypothetical protein [Microbacteriaceae bacterium]
MAVSKSVSVTFASREQISDLATFIDRSGLIDNSAARLVAKGNLLVAWVQVLAPRGLNDTTPTVLGMRGAELVAEAKFDIVVPIDSLRARFDNAEETDTGFVVTMPLQAPSVRWKIPLPPQTGWESLGKIGASDLQNVVREGMKIIKRKIPNNAEEHVVRSYRSQVWGTTINGSLGLPAGVALAAETLGFFGDKVMDVSAKEPWIRLSSTRGEILAKHTPVVLDGD